MRKKWRFSYTLKWGRASPSLSLKLIRKGQCENHGTPYRLETAARLFVIDSSIKPSRGGSGILPFNRRQCGQETESQSLIYAKGQATADEYRCFFQIRQEHSGYLKAKFEVGLHQTLMPILGQSGVAFEIRRRSPLFRLSLCGATRFV